MMTTGAPALLFRCLLQPAAKVPVGGGHVREPGETRSERQPSSGLGECSRRWVSPSPAPAHEYSALWLVCE